MAGLKNQPKDWPDHIAVINCHIQSICYSRLNNKILASSQTVPSQKEIKPN